MKKLAYLTAGLVLGSFATLIGQALSTGAGQVDPVKQSPQYYKVLLDEEHVRVLEYHLKPGENEPMHSHRRGVVYYFAAAKFKTSFPDGRVVESDVIPGETIWRNDVTHASTNIGNTEAHALAVELKEPCK